MKREDDGSVSRYVHDHLNTGDVVEVSAPRGSFCLNDGREPVVLLSAGVGVTPVLSMLHHVVETQPDRAVWWLHAARNGDQHPFAREVRTLLSQIEHCTAEISYSRPTATDRIGRNYDRRGHLNADAISRLKPPRNGRAYLCGPQSFMEEMSVALKGYGLDPAKIHTETFGAYSAISPGIAKAAVGAPRRPVSPTEPGPIVEFARSAISAPWNPSYGSVLELAEACNVPTRWSCRTGVCHTCETGMLAGQVSYEIEPLDPPAPGNILLCISKPTEAMVLDL